MSVQVLARSLAAVGWANSPESEDAITTLYVNNGNLIEKLWVGGSAKSETLIASNARTDTSAAYISQPEQQVHLIIFIDKSNSLQCAVYQEEEEQWEQTPLGQQWNVTTHEHSKVSAGFGPTGEIVISYQNPAGRLVGISSAAEGKWDSFGPLESDSLPGTPQYQDVVDEKLRLFYIGQDGDVRYSVLDSQSGKWQDSAKVLGDPKLDGPVSNFVIEKDPEKGDSLYYFLTTNSLWSVEGDKKTCFGKVEQDGKLVPADKAQAGHRTRWTPSSGGARSVEIIEKRGYRRVKITYWN